MLKKNKNKVIGLLTSVGLIFASLSAPIGVSGVNKGLVGVHYRSTRVMEPNETENRRPTRIVKSQNRHLSTKSLLRLQAKRSIASKTGAFEIKKIDQDNKPLPRAIFSLTPKDEKEKLGQTFTSNDKGIVDAQNIQSGVYILKEKTAPAGYDKTNRTWTVTVYDNGYTKLVENPYESGETISKIGTKDVSQFLQLVNPKMSVFSKYGETEVTSGTVDFYRNHAAYFKMSFELKQKDKSETINPGDTFVLQLDQRLNPNGISQDIPKIIYDKENSPLAIGKYDAGSHRLIYTFTDYIAGLEKIQLSAELSLFLKNKVVLENQTISDFKSTIGGQEIKYDGAVNALYGNEPNQKDSYVTNGLSNIGGSIESYNTQTGDFTWYVYVNPNRTHIPYATMNLWGFGRARSNTSNLENDANTSSALLGEIQVYEVPEGEKLPSSYGVDVTKLILREEFKPQVVQNSFRVTKRQRIDFNNNLKDGKRFVVKITGKTDQSGNPLVVQSNLASFNNETAVTSSNPVNNVYFQNEIALSPSKGSGSGTSEFTKPSITVANLKRVAQLRFKKVSTDNVPLPEATFELRSSNGNSQKLEASSNTQGEVHFKDLNSGTYDLYETKAPKGYQQVTEKLATVTVDTTKPAEEMVKWEKIHPFVKVEVNKEVTIVNHKETLTFSGKKIWENDRPDQRPAKIQVQLLQNGQKMSDKVQEVTKDNDWSYHFKDLPKYDDKNQVYKYSVEEVKVPDGYKVSYLGNDIFNTRETEFVFEQNNFNLEFGNAEIKGQSGSKIIDEDTLTSFKGKKIWKNDTSENRPQAIQVQLYADGVAVEGQTKFISGSGDEWPFEFKHLKKQNRAGNDIIYSVKEVTVPDGYEVTYSGNDIVNTKREMVTQQGPNLELEETLPTETGASGGTTTVEDSLPVDTLSGLSGEQGQSGDTTIEEDSATHIKFSKRDIDGKELAGATIELRDSSGKTISTWVSDGHVKDFYLMPGKYTFVETAAPEGYALATAIRVTIEASGQVLVNGKAVTADAPIVMVDYDKPLIENGPVVEFEESLPAEQGQSGATEIIEEHQLVEMEQTLPQKQEQSASTEVIEEHHIVETEESLPEEHGHSGTTTEVEDSKQAEIVLGGQDQVIDIEETLPTERGQSGDRTDIEDSKLPLRFHFDNQWPEDAKVAQKIGGVAESKSQQNQQELPETGEKENFLLILGLLMVSSLGLGVGIKAALKKS
ncbi:SpaA isopeptide-forming pilin-related protein [Streptococcus canis]|uniref:SpaA isopeptide-forming pilin-related protein n=1 Tax=Streptococcus canis TaxID=1329 RepID=UPI0024DE51A4|nr:SpaA isopeptide-forming pilin-related protein [Streptococcus canis]